MRRNEQANGLQEIIARDTERLAADWDYAWHQAKQAYFSYNPPPDLNDHRYRDLEASRRITELERDDRAIERDKLRILQTSYRALRSASWHAIYDAIQELNIDASTKDLDSIFDLAIIKIDAADGVKRELLGLHAAADFLLHWYQGNIGKPTWSRPLSKPDKPKRKSDAIVWLAKKFQTLSGMDRDFTTNAETIIKKWRCKQKIENAQN